ncbi:MAG TPA: metalloregulator ArsR/SmtB family transcription factor [Candidatus Limnocylindria bacterium]|nr:metalloregulator ArsR/SmtB family transcription factor [Candidatus Limnocylindria bacterium]
MRRTSSAGPRARVEAAPAYELVLSLAVAASQARTPQAAAVRDAAGDALIARVRAFAASDWMWAHLLGLAYEAPPPRDVAAFRAYVYGTRPLQLQRELVGYYVRWFRRSTPVDVMDAAIRGDADAIATFVGRGSGEDAWWSRSLRARLEAGAARTKAELLPLLDEWIDRVFTRSIEPTLRRVRAEASIRRRAMSGRTPEDAVSEMLGWQYVPEPNVARVLLIPSLVIHPTTHEFEREQTKLICVPIGPTHVPPRVSPELVALTRALADENRLRSLSALAGSDLGAQELADRLGLGLSTVLHHLAELRAVGLVERGGRRRPYRIAKQGLDRAAALLRSVAGTRDA